MSDDTPETVSDTPSDIEMLGPPIVAGLVVLMDEDGHFGAYLAQQSNPKYPMPSRDTLDAIIRMLAFEWAATPRDS